MLHPAQEWLESHPATFQCAGTDRSAPEQGFCLQGSSALQFQNPRNPLVSSGKLPLDWQ